MKNRMLKLPRSCGVDASLALPVLIGSAGNIGCVVGVVLMNKYMQLAHDFDHLVFLSFCHFAFTAVGTRAMLCCRVFRYKAARPAAVAPVALGTLSSVGFMNLNLKHNSVLTHLKTILTIVGSMIFFGIRTNARDGVGIVVALAGVVSYTEVKRRAAVRSAERERRRLRDLPTEAAAGSRQEWSVEEDDEVNRAVARLGKKAWAQVAEELNASGVTGPGCARTGKQVRARWVSSLDPDIRSGPWTAAEEQIIRDAQRDMGNKWAEIAKKSRARRRERLGGSDGRNRESRAARRRRRGPERPAPPERGARRRARQARSSAPRPRRRAPPSAGGFSDGLAPPDGLMSPPGDSPSWNRATPHESPSWTGDKAADEAPWTGDKAAWTPGARRGVVARGPQALSERFYAEIEPPRDAAAAADVKLPSVDTFRSIWLSEAA
ncbi:RNA polymerase II transcription regulator recruiting protein [Aureococcus anophagefferens]|nr:RNA polymerase II transcription regulator recruiting protein [Aureococcus anophagefferens]